MDKAKLDTLYYLLREVSNEASIQQSPELADAVYRLAGHLLAGTNYLGLVRYSRYYGEQFLLQPTYEAIHRKNWGPTRFVEFGAALGWLCRGLAVKFGIKDVFTVDKRAWTAIDLIADLETVHGIKCVQEIMKDGDVIVMSDFLHCIDNVQELLQSFSKYPIAALEYVPTNQLYRINYIEQLKRYGGSPMESGVLINILGNLGRKIDVEDLDSYILILIDR